MSNDGSDFIDSEFQSARKSAYTAPLPAVEISPVLTSSIGGGNHVASGSRPPTREEIEAQVSAKQQELAKLKRAQEELERERAVLEEMRRRQAEYHNGREEMLQNLTRGIGLLEDMELTTRREAEQMARFLGEFRVASDKVQAINENVWTQENLTVELTRALTTIENARMEWNSARLKFPLLNGMADADAKLGGEKTSDLASLSMQQLCKLGFALTWPLVALGLVIFLTLLLRR